MGRSLLTVVLALAVLCLSACASAPKHGKASAQPWPESVSDTCPERTVSLECFRRADVGASMDRLVEQFRACHPMGGERVEIMLRVETRGGSASCVERKPLGNEAALCVASVVARELVIPDSSPDERCSFRYPVTFD